MARIIFLHGASSAGKSTIANAVQAAWTGVILHLSIDHLRDSGALAPHAQSGVLWRANRAKFFDGFHAAIGGFADAGNDLCLEHILDTPGWKAGLAKRLVAHHLLYVGVMCPLDVLRTREAGRGDRPPGSAAKDHAAIHKGQIYDLILDGTAPADDNAARLLAALTKPQRSAFFAESAP